MTDRRLLTGGILLLTSFVLRGSAQGPRPQPPAPPPINQSDDPMLRAFRFRSIGPANIGGRIDDIAVVESNPSTIYLGFATGGVWKSVNNGTTWTPVFDTYPVASIGDIAISPSNPDIVYVGTGEANNRQSSSFGAGVYKSTDAGKTFTLVGLDQTQSIARIVVDPKDPNIVYVAALGHLFGPNPDRGVYKTTDGGKTWNKVKYVDDDTGFTDIVMDPSDAKILYAASYQRRRVPWGFDGSGPGSGIWKTTDAGRTWTKLTGNGLPSSPFIGRIGLDVSRSRPNVVYAQIEVGASGGTGAGVTDAGLEAPPTANPFVAMLSEMGTEPTGQTAGRPGGPGAVQAPAPKPPDPNKSGVWRSDDKGRTWHLTSNTNNRPMYYSQIRIDPTNSEIVYTGGAPFFKSADGGRTFKQVQGVAHSDHHAIWIDPRNGKHLLIGNDGGLDVSYDEAATWEYVNNVPAGQFYAISADMRKPYYICGGLQDNGSWCGPSATRSSNGIINEDWYRVGGGDGFYTQNDPTEWTTVYAESQDGNTNRLDLRTGKSVSIRPRAQRPPRTDSGSAPAAQGQPSLADTLQKIAEESGFGPPANANIVPAPPVGERFRFYWNTPVLISPHNPRVVYIGADRLFISRDRGDTWTMTPDLTKNVSRFSRPIMGVAGDKPMASKHDGAAAYSNIVTIGESPVLPGVLWVGTNDGNLQVSRDGGATWRNVVDNVPGVPKETHVSRVEPSHFDPATCYVTFDGHRTDDMKPYVFVTRDYGQTWASLVSNLPTGNVNVIREDSRNRNLLFLGTEYAFYVSLDGGREWKRFMNGLPTVRIDDILIHPRDRDLILGTHGRSIWIMDDITPLEALADGKAAAEDVRLFDVRPATQWIDDIAVRRQMGGAKHYEGRNPPPGTAISYLLKEPVPGDVKITIADIDGKTVRELTGTNQSGINRVEWNLRGTPPPRPAGLPPAFGGPGGFGAQFFRGPVIEPGTYLVKLSAGGKTLSTKVVVEADDLTR